MSGFTLYLMRHGAPEGAGHLLGHGDARPSSAGIALCHGRARSLRVTRVVSSDLARAAVPASAIATAAGVDHDRDARWRELDFGAWDGCDPAHLPQDQVAAFWDDPVRHPPPGGEDWHAICNRVGDALNDIADTTLVISHAGAIRAALSCLFGWDHRQCWAIALPYGALVTLTIWPGDRRGAQITGLIGT